MHVRFVPGTKMRDLEAFSTARHRQSGSGDGARGG